MRLADRGDIEQLVRSELAQISEEAVRDALQRYLVPAVCQMRRWEFGADGVRFPCWVVAAFSSCRTVIAYCESGFGPGYPWGIVPLDEDAMGDDGAWHINLEHAFRNSPAWVGRNPPGYEVP